MNSVVSIITPNYNRADLVRETAGSIFTQSYLHWEWVIVDDGSTDDSWAVLQELAAQDKRVKILQRNRGPKGACTCRNIAVGNCAGKYVIFLDTDDLLAPFCLEQRVRAIEEDSQCDFVIFPMLLFENKWDDLKLLWNIENETDDLRRILTNDAICQGTGTIWKKKSFQSVGMWREDLALWQDIELHIRSLLYPMKYRKRFDLPPDIYLRITPNSLSRGGFYSMVKIKSRISVLTYTCKKMLEKDLFEIYRAELKNMGLEIAISTILGNQFEQTDEVLSLAHTYNLFEQTEIKHLKSFLLVRKYKLHKIKKINNRFLRKATAGIIPFHGTLGKVAWTPARNLEDNLIMHQPRD